MRRNLQSTDRSRAQRRVSRRRRTTFSRSWRHEAAPRSRNTSRRTPEQVRSSALGSSCLVAKCMSDRPADFVPRGDGRRLARRRFTQGDRRCARHAGGALHRAGEPCVEHLRAVPHDYEVQRRVTRHVERVRPRRQYDARERDRTAERLTDAPRQTGERPGQSPAHASGSLPRLGLAPYDHAGIQDCGGLEHPDTDNQTEGREGTDLPCTDGSGPGVILVS